MALERGWQVGIRRDLSCLRERESFLFGLEREKKKPEAYRQTTTGAKRKDGLAFFLCFGVFIFCSFGDRQFKSRKKR